MIASVTYFKVKSGKMDAVIEQFKGYDIPAAKSREGYHGVWLFTDHKTGKGIALSFWDSKEVINADTQGGDYQERVKKYKELFDGTTVRELYEISARG